MIVGLLFVAGLYPILMMHPEPAEGSWGLCMGVFVAIAAWNRSGNRTLIAFTAWSSLAHGGIMAVQALPGEIPGSDLVRAVLPLAIIGVSFIALTPRRTKAGDRQLMGILDAECRS